MTDVNTITNTADDNDLRSLSRTGGLFLLIGLVVLTASVWQLQHETDFEATAATTSGTVIDLASSQRRRLDSDGFSRRDVYYYPIVEFIDSQGRTQTMQSSFGSKPPAYKRGEKVTILYDPDNPEFAMIDDWHRNLSDMIMLGIGGIFSVVGAGIFFTATRQRKTLKETLIHSSRRSN